METITLKTESFLFNSSEGQFRAMPFHELSTKEWVVFENGEPKYLIDFNRNTKPLIQDLTAILNSGGQLEEEVQRIGRFLGRDWTTKHNIQGKEIPNSQQSETIALSLLDTMADLFMSVIFVATDSINLEILLDEYKLIESFAKDDEWGIEYAGTRNQEDLICMLTFFFKQSVVLTELTSNDDKKIYDLTHYKSNCITTEEFESEYENFLLTSKRNNTMTQYGILWCAISYIQNNIDKKYLLAIAEKKKHWI